MDERRTDFELLRAFFRRDDQQAFATIVHRHLNIVYGTAYRKIGDQGAAEEIAQSIFAALARKSWQFGPNDSVPAWLHKSALLESKSWLRKELARRRRELDAGKLGTAMSTEQRVSIDPTLLAALDDGLLSLRDKERSAILLRFYEGRSMSEVAAALGIQEDAAQKRVAAALMKLTAHFQKRGIRTVTSAAATVALQHAGASLPATAESALIANILQNSKPALGIIAKLLSHLTALRFAKAAGACTVAAAVVVYSDLHRHERIVQKTELARRRSDELLRRNESDLPVIARLTNELAGLVAEQQRSAAAETEQAEGMRRFETLRVRARGLLAASENKWPDDLPFVRIPKSALPSMAAHAGPETPQNLQAKVFNLLNLDAVSAEAADRVFSNYFAAVDGLMMTNFYQTNHPSTLQLPAEGHSIVFVLEPSGPGIRAALSVLTNDLAGVLGEDRWRMVKPNDFEFYHYEQNRFLGYTQYAWDQRQELVLTVLDPPIGEPVVKFQSSTGDSASPTPLRTLLSTLNSGSMLSQGPPAFAQHVREYLGELAKSR